MSLCGKCLHSRESHTIHSGHFMYCPICLSLCDLEEYNINYKPSKIIINDLMRYDLN